MKALKLIVLAIMLVSLSVVSVCASQISTSCGGVKKINIDAGLSDGDVVNKILLCRSYPDCEVVFDTTRMAHLTKLVPVPKYRLSQKCLIGKYTSYNDSVYVGVKILPMTDEKTDPTPIVLFVLFSLTALFLIIGKGFKNNFFQGCGVFFLFITFFCSFLCFRDFLQSLC
jgi:hypothetical protein